MQQPPRASRRVTPPTGRRQPSGKAAPALPLDAPPTPYRMGV